MFTCFLATVFRTAWGMRLVVGKNHIFVIVNKKLDYGWSVHIYHSLLFGHRHDVCVVVYR